jgi:putative ABC transport system permease protein
MSGKMASPPRFAAWLVARVVPGPARAIVLGDLEERFAVRAERDGVAAAKRWYWRQAGGFVLRVPLTRTGHGSRARARTSALLPAPAFVAARPGTRRSSRAGIAGGLLADVRLAVRTLRRRPGLAVTATAVLALAVGANTTVFTVVDAILLQRLPYPDAERLVMLWDASGAAARTGERMPITYAHYRTWTEQEALFSAVGAWESSTPALAEGEWPERIDGAVVTASLLPMLGARPALGRLLLPADEAPGAPPVVLLSHDLWSSRFGADASIVGRTIRLNGIATQVVGVLGEDFWFYDPYSAVRSLTGRNAQAARLWQPLPAGGLFEGDENYPRYRVIARVRAGVSIESAAQAAAAVRRRLPPTSSDDGAELRLVPLTEQVVAEARPRLLGLFAAVSLVLLIACVNLVSLLLVHLEARRAEFAVRVALGAGRARLMRQLIVESALLALCGGLLGLVVSVGATALLLELVPRGLPLAQRAALDGRVAAFGIGLSVLAGVAIGLSAALRVDPTRLAGALSAAPRTVAGTRRTRRLHGTLVSAEVALSVVLLIAATLLLRGLVALHAADTGFDPEGVLTFEAVLSTPPGAAPSYEYFAALEGRLAALPGVAAVGATTALPFSRWVRTAGIAVDGVGVDEPRARADFRSVSPGYFRAIGLPVLAGRGFEAADRGGTPPVAVVNEAFVARWLSGGAGAIGRTVAITLGETTVHTVVGVVANVKHHDLLEAARPILYVPVRQSPVVVQRFAVRVSSADPLSLVDPIRRVAAELDPTQPLQNFISFEALIAQSIEDETFYAQIVGAFAATAVLLTLVGIYGVVSYATRQRDREVAIRVALGAGAGSVRRLVLGQGLVPVAIGLAFGVAGGLASSRLLAGLLHGIPAHDATSYGVATLVFGTVAAAACFVPARRAARLDPMRVMRGD